MPSRRNFLIGSSALVIASFSLTSMPALAMKNEIFAAEPEKYAPKYGGYCAYAVSRGYTAPTDPEAFSIVDDKLYLNFSLNVRKTWRKKMAENIAKANKNWPDVLK